MYANNFKSQPMPTSHYWMSYPLADFGRCGLINDFPQQDSPADSIIWLGLSYDPKDFIFQLHTRIWSHNVTLSTMKNRIIRWAKVALKTCLLARRRANYIDRRALR